MSVSSISASAASGLNPTGWRNTVKQGKQDFNQLLGALKSGNVSGAQQAYAAMQQLLPGIQAQTQAIANAASGTAPAGSVAAAVTSDFSALGTALSSGNLSAAQDAVAKLQQDLQAALQGQGVGRHRHHHAASGGQNAVSSYIANSVIGSTASGNSVTVAA